MVMSLRGVVEVRDLRTKKSAEDQSRTDDTRIFSPLLYQLSYLGVASKLPYTNGPVNVRGTVTGCYELPGFLSATPAAQSGHVSAL